MRIDKFLWCVRLFKTRSLATEAVNSERIRLSEEIVKASKEVKKGDEISVKTPPIWRTYKVLEFPKSRVGAKLVEEYIAETTSEFDLEELEKVRLVQRQNREAGLYGRPTKRNRRDLDKFRGE